MAKKKKKQQTNSFWRHKYFFIGIKILFIFISILAILNQGFLGNLLSSGYKIIFGNLFPIYVIAISIILAYTIINKSEKFYQNKIMNIIALVAIILWLIASFSYVNSFESFSLIGGVLRVPVTDMLNGGILGFYIVGLIYMLIGKIGMYIVIGIVIVGTLIYALFGKKDLILGFFNKRINDYKREKELKKDSNIKEEKVDVVEKPKNEKLEEEKTQRRTNVIKINRDTNETIDNQAVAVNENNNFQIHKEDKTVVKADSSHMKKNVENYVFPDINHLKSQPTDSSIDDELERIAKDNAKILETTLSHFNIQATITDIHIGPNITKYELAPKAGVKVSKFSGISNDLAMALAAKTIRVEAPIPGKSAVGIEVPNKKGKSVYLKDILSETDNNKLLQIPLGKDISGKTRFLEVNKTPHMLVAGATGSGKSVFINSMIVSLLYKATSEDLKMIMIDPKKVELAPYNGIPHLLTPVVTDPKKAAIILKKMVAEMEYRYEMFAKTNTRNIEGYNKKVETDKDLEYKKFPYIIIIIDELADLMMVASNEVETAIARIAQMARAAGIHLVIATQRPSTDVITGLIKSNIPTRLSFSVSSSIDSRTILDSSGAEKLLGKGDMLYSANGENELIRIQGTYLSDEEILAVVQDIIEQNESFSEEVKQDQFAKELENLENQLETDELYDEAKKLVIQYQRASTSLLQRELRIGFNRASKIMQQLEETNVISVGEGTKPRKVLVEEEIEE